MRPEMAIVFQSGKVEAIVPRQRIPYTTMGMISQQGWFDVTRGVDPLCPDFKMTTRNGSPHGPFHHFKIAWGIFITLKGNIAGGTTTEPCMERIYLVEQ